MTLSLTARLYSKMTGEPVSSSPSESMRPLCFAPVLYSVARKRTPKSVSMFASISRCRETSRATDLPLSSWADPLVMRNSLRSLNSGSQLQCGSHGFELDQCSSQVLDDFAGDDLRGRKVVQVLQSLVTQPGDVEVGLVPCHQLVVGVGLEPFRLHPLRAWLPRCVAVHELVQVVTAQRGLLQGEVLVGAQVIHP